MHTEMARERFPKDDDMSQALVLAAHLADRQWAGAKAFTVAREAVIVANEAETWEAEVAAVAQREEARVTPARAMPPCREN
jgi:hypothetical protein